jgi:hypothetical protein
VYRAVVITILYFLLATIIALLITALYMGCNELEPMAVKLAPDTFKPLLRWELEASEHVC